MNHHRQRDEQQTNERERRKKKHELTISEEQAKVKCAECKQIINRRGRGGRTGDKREWKKLFSNSRFEISNLLSEISNLPLRPLRPLRLNLMPQHKTKFHSNASRPLSLLSFVASKSPGLYRAAPRYQA